MCVVELYGEEFVELLGWISRQIIHPQHVLKRARDKKVLLFKSQLLSLVDGVVRIEDLCDGLRSYLGLDRAVIIANVESLEVERVSRFCFPKAQKVSGANLVTDHRRVVSNAFNHAVRNPLNA